MAVGPAVPNKPQQDIVAAVTTPMGVKVEQLRINEELRKEVPAKSVPQIQGEDEVTPTGEDIHAAAREKSTETVQGKTSVLAKDATQDKKPVTGVDLVAEVTEKKKAALEAQDKAGADQAKRVAKAEEKIKADDEARKEADKKMAEEASKQADKKVEATKAAQKDK